MKSKTLTKIDLKSLRPKLKLLVVSHHSTGAGTRVTTTLPPAHQPIPDPLANPYNFEADVPNFNKEEFSEGDDDGDKASRGYYVARVCTLSPSTVYVETHPHQDNPFSLLKDECELFLEELMRHEGRGVFTDDGHCELCRDDGMYRCLDCIGVHFLCAGCISRVHSFNPFHTIEVSFWASHKSFCAVLTR